MEKQICLLLFSFLFLIGCGPVDANDPILEKAEGVILEKHMTVTHDWVDGTRRYCQLLLELSDKRRIAIKGNKISGAAPYELCQYIREGESVRLVRYRNYGWYLAETKY